MADKASFKILVDLLINIPDSVKQDIKKQLEDLMKDVPLEAIGASKGKGEAKTPTPTTPPSGKKDPPSRVDPTINAIVDTLKALKGASKGAKHNLTLLANAAEKGKTVTHDARTQTASLTKSLNKLEGAANAAADAMSAGTQREPKDPETRPRSLKDTIPDPSSKTKKSAAAADEATSQMGKELLEASKRLSDSFKQNKAQIGSLKKVMDKGLSDLVELMSGAFEGATARTIGLMSELSKIRVPPTAPEPIEGDQLSFAFARRPTPKEMGVDPSKRPPPLEVGELDKLLHDPLEAIGEGIEVRVNHYAQMLQRLSRLTQVGHGGVAKSKVNESDIAKLMDTFTSQRDNLVEGHLQEIRRTLRTMRSYADRAQKGQPVDTPAIKGIMSDFHAAGAALKQTGAREAPRFTKKAEQLMKGMSMGLVEGLVAQVKGAQESIRQHGHKAGVSEKAARAVDELHRAMEEQLLALDDASRILKQREATDPLMIGKPGGRIEAPGVAQLGLATGKIPDFHKLTGPAREAMRALTDVNIAAPFEKAKRAMIALNQEQSKAPANLRLILQLYESMAARGHEDAAVKRTTLQLLRDRQREMERLETFQTDKRHIGILETAGADRTVYQAFNREMDTMRKRVAADPAIPVGQTVEMSRALQTASGATQNVMIQMKKLGNEADQVALSMTRINKIQSDRETLKLAFRRVAVWGMAAGILYGLSNALRRAFQSIREVENGMVQLVKVMREADVDIKGFQQTALAFAQSMAIGYGTTIQGALEAMGVFAKQGLAMAEVQRLTEASVMAANVTVLDQAEAAEGLTAAIRQFNLEANNAIAIIDQWNEVAKRNAVTEKVLTEAIKKAGSAAATVGIQHEQYLGLVTAIGTATRHSGEQIGTSLRFIFQRTLRPETEGRLNALGIATRDLMGNFRGFMPVLQDIAAGWNDYNQGQQLAIAQAMGGVRQYNSFLVLMRNYDLALKATSDALQSSGSAYRENERVMETTDKKLQQLGSSATRMAVDFGGVLLPAIKGVVDGFRGLLSLANRIPDSIKAGSVALLGLVGVLARMSYRLDMVMGYGAMKPVAAAGAPGVVEAGAAVGTAGMLSRIGRGRTVGEISAAPKMAGLTPLHRNMRQLSDYALVGSATFSNMKINAEGALEAVGRGGEKINKFNAAVKRKEIVWKTSSGEMKRGILGYSAFNSIIPKTQLLLARSGQSILWVGAAFAGLVPKMFAAITGYKLVSKSAAASAAATMKAKALTVGFAPAMLVLAAAGVAVYKMYKNITKEAVKTGKEVEKSLTAEITKRELTYNTYQQHVTAMERLEQRRRDAVKFRGEELDLSNQRIAEEVARGTYLSPAVQERRISVSQQEAANLMLFTRPDLIKGVDDFGHAIIDTAVSFEQMTEAAKSAQSSLIALQRVKIAEAFANDVKEANKELQKALTYLGALAPVARQEVRIFGGMDEFGNIWNRQAQRVHDARVLIEGHIDALIQQMRSMPKEASMQDFVSFGMDSNIRSALRSRANEINNALVRSFGASAERIGFGNIINREFLRSARGFTFIQESARETAGVAAQEFKTIPMALQEFIDKGMDLVGTEVMLFGGERPFGLDQAAVIVQRDGQVIIEGINAFGYGVRKALSEVEAEVQDAGAIKILQTEAIVSQMKASVLEANKAIAGAAAGLIEFPTQVDLGVRFRTELTDIQRIQRLLPAATSEVYRLQDAYRQSAKVLGEGSEDMSESMVAKELLDYNEQQRMIAGIATLSLSFSSELEKIANSIESASYTIQDAALDRHIERQFKNIYGAARGLADSGNIDFIKTYEDLSDTQKLERVAPGFVESTLAGSMHVDELYKAYAEASKLVSRDFGRMVEDFRGGNVENYIDNLLRFNDEQFATSHSLAQETHKVQEKQLKELEKISGTEKETEAVATRRSLERSVAIEVGQLTRFFADQNRQGGDVWRQAFDAMSRFTPGTTPTYAIGEESHALFARVLRDIVIEKGETGDLTIDDKDILRALIGLRVELHKELAQSREHMKTLAEQRPREYQLFGKQMSWVVDQISKGLGKPGVGEWYRERMAKYRPLESSEAENRASAVHRNIRDMLRRIETDPTAISNQLEEALRNIVTAAEEVGVKTIRDRDSAVELTAEGIEQALTSIINGGREYAKVLKEQIKATLDNTAQQLAQRRAVATVASGLLSFVDSISKSVRDFNRSIRIDREVKEFGAQLSGALAGVVVPQIDVGKAEHELSAQERLARRHGPMMTGVEEVMLRRNQAIDLYKRLFDSEFLERAAEQVATVSDQQMPQAQALQQALSRVSELQGVFRNALIESNVRLSPFIESLRRLTVLEEARRGIEGIIRELDKAKDLYFDSTSIDMALGRHPLSRTQAVYGQPAGLDKFQREMLEARQTIRGGPFTREEYQNVQLQKQKIRFNREEALIQYQQNKENEKLTQQVSSAQRAMGILYDAQLSGVGGLQGLLDGLRRDLSRAGDVVRSGPAGELFYRGVPSLDGLTDELKRVQEAVKIKEFEKQRDILIKPLLQVQQEANKQRDYIASLLREIDANLTSPEEDPGLSKLPDALRDVAAGFIKGMDPVVEKLGEASTAIGAYTQNLQQLQPQLERGFPIRPQDTTRPGQGLVSGGYVSGPGGIDNVSARLTAGEYVIPRGVVGQYGKGFFDNMLRPKRYAAGGPVDIDEEHKKLHKEFAHYAPVDDGHGLPVGDHRASRRPGTVGERSSIGFVRDASGGLKSFHEIDVDRRMAESRERLNQQVEDAITRSYDKSKLHLRTWTRIGPEAYYDLMDQGFSAEELDRVYEIDRSSVGRSAGAAGTGNVLTVQGSRAVLSAEGGRQQDFLQAPPNVQRRVLQQALPRQVGSTTPIEMARDERGRVILGATGDRAQVNRATEEMVRGSGGRMMLRSTATVSDVAATMGPSGRLTLGSIPQVGDDRARSLEAVNKIRGFLRGMAGSFPSVDVLLPMVRNFLDLFGVSDSIYPDHLRSIIDETVCMSAEGKPEKEKPIPTPMATPGGLDMVMDVSKTLADPMDVSDKLRESAATEKRMREWEERQLSTVKADIRDFTEQRDVDPEKIPGKLHVGQNFLRIKTRRLQAAQENIQEFAGIYNKHGGMGHMINSQALSEYLQMARNDLWRVRERTNRRRWHRADIDGVGHYIVEHNGKRGLVDIAAASEMHNQALHMLNETGGISDREGDLSGHFREQADLVQSNMKGSWLGRGVRAMRGTFQAMAAMDSKDLGDLKGDRSTLTGRMQDFGLTTLAWSAGKFGGGMASLTLPEGRRDMAKALTSPTEMARAGAHVLSTGAEALLGGGAMLKAYIEDDPEELQMFADRWEESARDTVSTLFSMAAGKAAVGGTLRGAATVGGRALPRMFAVARGAGRDIAGSKMGQLAGPRLRGAGTKVTDLARGVHALGDSAFNFAARYLPGGKKAKLAAAKSKAARRAPVKASAPGAHKKVMGAKFQKAPAEQLGDIARGDKLTFMDVIRKPGGPETFFQKLLRPTDTSTKLGKAAWAGKAFGKVYGLETALTELLGVSLGSTVGMGGVGAYYALKHILQRIIKSRTGVDQTASAFLAKKTIGLFKGGKGAAAGVPAAFRGRPPLPEFVRTPKGHALRRPTILDSREVSVRKGAAAGVPAAFRGRPPLPEFVRTPKGHALRRPTILDPSAQSPLPRWRQDSSSPRAFSAIRGPREVSVRSMEIPGVTGGRPGVPAPFRLEAPSLEDFRPVTPRAPSVAATPPPPSRVVVGGRPGTPVGSETMPTGQQVPSRIHPDAPGVSPGRRGAAQATTPAGELRELGLGLDRAHSTFEQDVRGLMRPLQGREAAFFRQELQPLLERMGHDPAITQGLARTVFEHFPTRPQPQLRLWQRLWRRKSALKPGREASEMHAALPAAMKGRILSLKYQRKALEGTMEGTTQAERYANVMRQIPTKYRPAAVSALIETSPDSALNVQGATTVFDLFQRRGATQSTLFRDSSLAHARYKFTRSDVYRMLDDLHPSDYSTRLDVNLGSLHRARNVLMHMLESDVHYGVARFTPEYLWDKISKHIRGRGDLPSPGGPVIPGLAMGGFVRGPGTSTSDSVTTMLEPGSFVLRERAARGLVPARVSDGEYIVPPDAVGRIGLDTLERINAGQGLPSFAQGGLVGEAAKGVRRSSGDSVDFSGLSKAIEDAVKRAVESNMLQVDTDDVSIPVEIPSREEMPKLEVDTSELREVANRVFSNMGAGPSGIGAAVREELEKVNGRVDIMWDTVRSSSRDVRQIDQKIDALKRDVEIRFIKTEDLNVKIQEINVEGKVIEYVDPRIRDISVEMGRMKSLLNNVMSVASSAASLTGRL